jgi:predicted DNA-binding transcriptional regulator AlpA
LEYAKRKDVAARIGVCESTLEKLAVTGGGPPFIRIGRAVRYRWSDVETWLEARRASSTTAHDAKTTALAKSQGDHLASAGVC